MSELRDRLGDLVADTPSYVVPDAGAAWRAGARRRRRRYAGTGLAVAVLVLLVGLGVGVLPRAAGVAPAGGERSGVDGYPTRVDRSWWIRDLPDAPGPVAGLLQQGRQWLAVSADGHLWRLPPQPEAGDNPPAISADGRRLGYLAAGPDDAGEVVLHDLVSGDRVVFSDIGDSRGDRSRPYLVYAQSPSFFSPGGDALLVPGARTRGGPRVRGLVLRFDGSITEARPDVRPLPRRMGWADDDSLAWLEWSDRRGVRQGHLLVTDIAGAVERRIGLAPLRRNEFEDQWTSSISPDGRRISITSDETAAFPVVQRVSAATGEETAVPLDIGEAVSSCPMGWADEDVAVPVFGQDADRVLVDDERTLVRADPRLGVTCSIWATDALVGEPRRGITARVFGGAGPWLTWHWRETAAGITVGVAAVWFVLLVRRRRRRESPHRPGPEQAEVFRPQR